jgi:hypothetical protein
VPLLPGADAIMRLRRTIFRAPGPLRWIAIAVLVGLVLLLVLVGVAVRSGLGIVPVVDARETGGDPGRSGGTAAPIGVPPSPGTAPTPLPDTYVPLVLAAGKICPAVPAARIAAQLMAASGFNPNVVGEDDAQGVAQFRPELWRTYAPSAAASPTDPNLAIPALGRAMCALVSDFEKLDGNPYLIALAAFQWGPEAVGEAGGLPDAPSLRTFADMVSGYTAYYEHDPRLGAIPATTPPRSGSPSPTPSPTPGATAGPTPTASSAATSEATTPPATTAPTPVWQNRVIRSTTTLRPGQSWTSNRLELALTGDGDIVLRDQGRAVWNANSGGKRGNLLVFQADGNLVLYTMTNAPIWTSGTAGNNGAILVLQADGNVVISANGRTLWQTGTAS